MGGRKGENGNHRHVSMVGKKMRRMPHVNRQREDGREGGRGRECLPKAGQCVSVADVVTPGLPLLPCLPREAINKEIMAEQFTQRLWVSLMPFKCANHFFHYSTERERERERGSV